MSLLTYNELILLVEQGVIGPVPKDNINAASIDVRLSNIIHIESHAVPMEGRTVDLAIKQNISTEEVDMTEKGYYDLPPGHFCLAGTMEIFNLPNDIAAQFQLKSSSARNGLEHLKAGWCDPGWNGSSLTMEFKNELRTHWLRLRPGMKVGQVVFFRGAEVPTDASYASRGQYNNDRNAQPSKGIQ